MGKHSKPLTQSQKRWMTVKYYLAMGFFAATMGYTLASAF